MKEHIIKEVLKGSIAEEMGLEPGDAIVSINDTIIEDIFDYQYLVQDEYIEVLVKTSQGEECLLEIDKEYSEDLGLVFEQGLMDDYRSCRNKCIFCFIDQLPKGMRDSLYFKDDDTRLSFLHGNYVTLTNISDEDIDHLIKYRLEPINISFQTMNPELRCKMLNNRFAGEALKKVDKLYQAEILMNGQIVLCKGVNDGNELRYSLDKLFEYYPTLQSVSVVPVGLTNYRDGLYPLEPFEKDDAINVIEIIEEYQKKALKKGGTHFCHASDEWYILAGKELPNEDSYDGYLQYENGVGMVTSLRDEVNDYINSKQFKEYVLNKRNNIKINKSIATGTLVYPYIKELAEKVVNKINELLNVSDNKITVYSIINEFFGERITVSGLITGQDLVKQLKNVDKGNCLLISECMVRTEEGIFLDDYTIDDVQSALQVPVRIVKSSGEDFVNSIIECVSNK